MLRGLWDRRLQGKKVGVTNGKVFDLVGLRSTSQSLDHLALMLMDVIEITQVIALPRCQQGWQSSVASSKCLGKIDLTFFYRGKPWVH